MSQLDWLVVFLMYADLTKKSSPEETTGFKNNQKTIRELNNVFNDLLYCNIRKGIRVIVILNRIKYKDLSDPSHPIEDLTFVYEFSDQQRRKKNNCKHLLNPIDNKDPKTRTAKPHGSDQLADVFKELLKAIKVVPRNIFLNTWDHGSAFGIFKEEEPDEAKFIREIKSIHQGGDKYEALNEVLNTNFINKISGMNSLYEILEVNSFDKDAEKIYNYANQYFSLQKTGKSVISEGLFENLKENELFFNNTSFHKTIEKPIASKNVYFVTLELREPVQPEDVFKLFGNIDNKEEFLRLFYNEQKLKVFGSFEVSLKYEILTNAELDDAINKGFNQKIDILLMMNCYMLNCDSLFTFRNNVDYLIAPAGVIDEPGYNYFEIINNITGISTSEFLSNISITTLSGATQSYRRRYIHQIETAFITGYKLNSKSILNFASYFNDVFCHQVIQYFSDNPNDEYSKLLLNFSRRVAYKFDEGKMDYELINIEHWVSNINYNHAGKISNRLKLPILQLIEQINTIKQLQTNTKFFGSSTYIEPDCLGKTIGYLPTGLSIYFPISIKQQQSSVNRDLIDNCLFLKHCVNWGTLLKIISP